MIDTSGLCQYLDWDSNFFGKRIGTIRAQTLSPDDMKAAMAWSKAEQIDCLYFAVDSQDSDAVRLVEDYRFRFVDVRLTLELKQLQHDSDPLDGAATFRTALPDDVAALKAIARSVHTDTRFFHDPHFSRALCEALYETWIEKSCNGYADAVLVPVLDEQPVGYISCHLPTAHSAAKIGLVGLAPNAQGLGLGGALITRALAWFSAQGVSHLTVVTQGRNTRAQRLYQRFGFLTQSVQFWYHKWFNE
jgi:dTDP-4-amino-4,6-dideoxy-D-galactose acyltransferase